MQPRLAPLAVLVLPSSPALAQESQPFAYEQPYAHASGTHSGTHFGAPHVPTLVHGHTIELPGAPALRVFFEELDVPGGGWLDVRSPADGQVHRLTAAEAARWQHSSGYFNTDTLVLELWAAPGRRASFEVSHLTVGLGGFADTACGADDRVPSDDNRALRYLNSAGTSACTGWTAGPDDCAFCAGHCFPGFSSTAEVNVPPSAPNGALQHPPLEDQFPVAPDSLDWNGGGLGDDWAVSRVLPNHLGESVAAKWGYYELGFFLPSPGDTIRITGFGADTGTANQTNQTSTGPYTTTVGHSIRYQVDTEGGNSGSPVIHEATGLAVGIHTNGGCTSSGGANSGTSLFNPELQLAWQALCDQQPPGVPVASFAASKSSVVQGESVHFTDTSSGIPTAWSWDFDEDGVEDSAAKFPSFAWEVPGTYSVTLAVSNDLGSDAVTATDLVTVGPPSPATMPYAEDFSGGLPTSGEWVFFSSNEFGAIAAGGDGSPSPISGDPALTLASSLNGVTVTNHAVLFLDLTGVDRAELKYWFKRAGDEADPEDGLFLSDGVTEVQALNHAVGSDWTERSVDLVQAATAGGVQLGPDFRIVWRQKDNSQLGTDGHVIDDVSIAADARLTSGTLLVSATAGGTQVLELSSGSAAAGEPYLVVGTVSGTQPGFAFAGWPVPLDPDFYSSYTVQFPNTFPLSNSAGFLDGSGEAVATFSIPPGSAPFSGLQFHHAYLTGALGAGEVTGVSNAVQLIVVP